MVKFACPHCFAAVPKEVWIPELDDMRRKMIRCPVCGSMMLRIDSEKEEYLVSLLKKTSRKIHDAIIRQQEDFYARR
jgi:Zn finger protein HypA/HybF involved in hydrogenase expression